MSMSARAEIWEVPGDPENAYELRLEGGCPERTEGRREKAQNVVQMSIGSKGQSDNCPALRSGEKRKGRETTEPSTSWLQILVLAGGQTQIVC